MAARRSRQAPFYEFFSDTARREVVYNARPVQVAKDPRLEFVELREDRERLVTVSEFESADTRTAETESVRAPEVCTSVSSHGNAGLTCEVPRRRKV